MIIIDANQTLWETRFIGCAALRERQLGDEYTNVGTNPDSRTQTSENLVVPHAFMFYKLKALAEFSSLRCKLHGETKMYTNLKTIN